MKGTGHSGSHVGKVDLGPLGALIHDPFPDSLATPMMSLIMHDLLNSKN